MSWMLLPDGAQYHFTGAIAFTDTGRPISIANIAHQLALINRFHGATTRRYSVAEHSLLVAEIARRAGASPIVQLAALMHDAHECFTQDLCTPAKHAIDWGANGSCPWSDFEREHATTVRRHFGLLTVFGSAQRERIREWDLIALATERRDLTAWDAQKHDPWPVLNGIEPAGWVDLASPGLSSQTWQDWRRSFHGEHLRLTNDVAAQLSS